MVEDDPLRRATSPKGSAATRSQIRGLATLPPLPRRSQELLQLLLDPDLDMLRLAELVEQTPALAARLLGVANSAFFRTPVPVKHIPDAIIRVLGLNLVRDLSVSFLLNQPFELKTCRQFDPVRFWISSMESATLAQLLTIYLPLQNPPTASAAYLAGLLNNLGLLALVHVAPEAMDKVLGQMDQQPDVSLSEIEQQVLGLNHARAGAELAMAWKLPPALAAVMGPLDQADDGDDVMKLVSLVVLCKLINRALKHGDFIDQDPELSRALAGLDVHFDAWPALLDQWHERTADIESLAAAFAGAGR
jgi:HD-like signal output (HDOD) protein